MNTLNAELRVVERGGSSRRVGAVRFYSYVMALRPGNGLAVATAILDPSTGTQELWLMDLEKNSAVPLTTTRGFAAVPVWSSDARRLAYAYQPPGQLDNMYVRDMGTGATTPVFATPGTLEHPTAWSRDGKSLLIFTSDERGGWSLSTWSFASRTSTAFAGPRALEVAAFSPHDEFVAFTSQESGRPEAYMTTFPESSPDLAAHDRWRTGAQLEPGRPRDSRRHALGTHRGLSGVDRRRLHPWPRPQSSCAEVKAEPAAVDTG